MTVKDPLAIPAFLRREGGRLTDTQFKQLIAPTAWAPFRQKGEVVSMAKYDEAITNRSAPVTVTLRDGAGKTSTRNFKNLDEFEAFYKPNLHHNLGTTNDANATFIMLDVRSLDGTTPPPNVSRSPVVKKERAPAPASPKKAARAPTGRANVWADGKEYPSVFAAFEALKLDVKAHKKFRVELKAKRKATYTEGKRKVVFEYK